MYASSAEQNNRQCIFERERSEDLQNTMVGYWLMFALAAAAVMAAEATTSHVVGGSATGWTIPSNATFYSQWASTQTFAVGDTLVFNFSTGIHNVIEVPKSSYDACSAKKQLGATLTTGPATVTIGTSGNHYYICGVSGHCSIGQKLAINVGAAAAAPPTSSSPTPPPVASNTPAKAPSAPASTTIPPTPAKAPSAPASTTIPPASPATGTSNIPSKAPSTPASATTAPPVAAGPTSTNSPPSSSVPLMKPAFSKIALTVAVLPFLLF